MHEYKTNAGWGAFVFTNEYESRFQLLLELLLEGYWFLWPTCTR